jgi:dipeptidyl aminopeptidase/acylaminoacyl peptidase
MGKMGIKKTRVLAFVVASLGFLFAGAVTVQGMVTQASVRAPRYDDYTQRIEGAPAFPDAAAQAQPSRLTFTPTFTAYLPLISLAAEMTDVKIAFVSRRDNNAEIYVMNADGRGASRLTDDSAVDFAPAWSPDSARIAFVSDRAGGYGIYVMGADGAGQVELSNGPSHDAHPHWSPDGTKIAFCSDRDGGVGHGRSVGRDRGVRISAALD